MLNDEQGTWAMGNGNGECQIDGWGGAAGGSLGDVIAMRGNAVAVDSIDGY